MLLPYSMRDTSDLGISRINTITMDSASFTATLLSRRLHHFVLIDGVQVHWKSSIHNTPFTGEIIGKKDSMSIFGGDGKSCFLL